MEKLKINIPIYVSVVSMAKHGLNVNDAIMDQLNQGDPMMDEIVKKLKDTYGENDLIDTEDFAPFIEGDSESITIDADECYYIGDKDCVALDVDFTFDIEAFGKEHNLEPIRNKILDYINEKQKGFDLEGVEITEEDVDDIQRKIKKDNMELEKACDEVLQGIRDVLDEGLEDDDVEMGKFESFISFESVVRIKNEAEFAKFCALMKRTGLTSIKYLERHGFAALHKNAGIKVIPDGELCFEYQVYKGFTIGKAQEYLDYGCEVISFDDLLTTWEG